MAIKGYGASEVERSYTRARELSQRLGESPRVFLVVAGLWAYYMIRADLKTARELAEQGGGAINLDTVVSERSYDAVLAIGNEGGQGGSPTGAPVATSKTRTRFSRSSFTLMSRGTWKAACS